MAERNIMKIVSGATGWFGLGIAVLALIMLANLIWGGGLNRRMEKIIESETSRKLIEQRVVQQLEDMKEEVEAIDSTIQGHLREIEQLTVRETKVREDLTEIHQRLVEQEDSITTIINKMNRNGF